IRDLIVTGVQTCALPISKANLRPLYSGSETNVQVKRENEIHAPAPPPVQQPPANQNTGTPNAAPVPAATPTAAAPATGKAPGARSEERRVGKECRERGGG